MSSSGLLVSKYFSEEQKIQLAIALVDNLEDTPQDSPVLAELISHLDSDIQTKINPQLLQFILRSIEGQDTTNLDHSLEFLKASSTLFQEIWVIVLSKLKLHVRCAYNFVQGFQTRVEAYSEECSSKNAASNPDEVELQQNILGLFKFLTLIYTCDELTSLHDLGSADKEICLYLGHRNEKIASASSQLLRWRIDTIVRQCDRSEGAARYYWSLLFDLQNSATSKQHTSNAFILWLRMLGNTNFNHRNDAHFQSNVINQDAYWRILQSNLVGKSHETRKLCLSILQLSIKHINTSFSTTIMSWDKKDEIRLLREWSRYTTLFEVLGIDTSLHQTQAAVNDIVGIISEGSLIHPSWGFCLLSTGFRASMDSVRKYSADILFSIQPENLHLLKHGLPFLEDHFLPYMMQSKHFAVRSSKRHSTDIHCEYADKFSNFICAVVKSLSTSAEKSEISFTILKVLAKARETFDAVRIYTCHGLVKGLQETRALQHGKHDVLLIKLFDNFSEGELFKKAIQTLNLRLILSFEFGGLQKFECLLTKFSNFNGYDIIAENLSLCSKYLLDCGINFDDLMACVDENTSIDQAALFLKLASVAPDKEDSVWNIKLASISELTVAKLLEFGITSLSPAMQSRVADVFDTAFRGSAPESLYRSLSNASSESKLALNVQMRTLWDQIQKDVLSEEYGTLCHAFAKLKFLNHSVDLIGFDKCITLPSIAAFHQIIFVNSAECSKKVANFYKLRQDMGGEFHRLLKLYVTHVGLKPEEFATVLTLLTFETSHFSTLLAITEILTESFTNGFATELDIIQSIVGLNQSVLEMTADRFKLNEKELHVSLINIFLHEEVLKSAITSEKLSDYVSKFSETIISNSYGRRGLMTTLTKALSSFQINHPQHLESLSFLPQLLIKAMVHRELSVSAFRIEKLVGTLYDREISTSPESDIYALVYGEDEIAYKVRLLAILNSVRSSGCAEAIIDAVFDPKDPLNFYHVLKPTDGAEEHVRLQLSKIVISVIDKVDFEVSSRKYLNVFIRFVEKDPSPLVRVYFEWMLSRHLAQKPELAETFFEKLVKSLETHELKPTLVTLYERVLFLMIQSLTPEDEVKYLTKLITIIVPAASTNKAVTRHFSMSLAMSIYDEIRRKRLNINQYLSDVIDNLYKSALATEAFGQFRSGDACLWNIRDDFDLIHISGGLLMRLYDRDVDFIMKGDFHRYLSKTQIDSLTHPIGDDMSDMWVKTQKEIKVSKSKLLESSNGVASSLQTKSGAWSTVMDIDSKTQISDVKRSELIVVASLVDKPPNLGGICRLCDVLGAGLLTLHDLSVRENQSFKSVAVTADYWMPMAEVKPDETVQFLRNKKAVGYTLIGLEQTDNSVALDSELKFPSRSLILLGREKEGIPGELLAELDFCIEIKQVGVVRSMNIQTAAAVIVHAYSSQHC